MNAIGVIGVILGTLALAGIGYALTAIIGPVAWILLVVVYAVILVSLFQKRTHA